MTTLKHKALAVLSVLSLRITTKLRSRDLSRDVHQEVGMTTVEGRCLCCHRQLAFALFNLRKRQ